MGKNGRCIQRHGDYSKVKTRIMWKFLLVPRTISDNCSKHDVKDSTFLPTQFLLFFFFFSFKTIKNKKVFEVIICIFVLFLLVFLKK
jgi:hypothetical protein